MSAYSVELHAANPKSEGVAMTIARPSLGSFTFALTRETATDLASALMGYLLDAGDPGSEFARVNVNDPRDPQTPVRVVGEVVAA